MLQKFINGLAKWKKPGLISHISPDGDAIGSQLALYYWFLQQKADPVMFNDDSVPSNLSWLANQEKIQVPEVSLLDECDSFVFIDGNEPHRFGKMADYFDNTDKPVYLVDHHLNPPENFFTGTLWDAGASSTAWLVYKMFEKKGLEHVTRDVAEALYCGILTDTGSFRFDTVTAETHFATGKIIQYGGISPAEIYSRIYEDKSLGEYHLLGKALDNIRLYCNGKVAAMMVSEKMLKESGCSVDDLEGFVNFPLSIRSVLVSVLLYEKEGKIKASLRGKSILDLNSVARAFHGGGHFNAAGAWHDGPMEDAISEITAKIRQNLDGCE